MCTSAHAPALTVSGQEQAKRAALKAAIGDQPRGAGFKPLIEEGCGPRLFVQTLKRFQHPAEEPVVLGTRLQQALTLVREQGCNIGNFREMRMQKIREKAAELDHLREGYQKVLHPRVKAVIGHLLLPLLDWLRNRFRRRRLPGFPHARQASPWASCRQQRQRCMQVPLRSRS